MVQDATRTTEFQLNGPLNRPLRLAMAGGGPGSFIGRKHSQASAVDRRTQIVAGAFSIVAEESPMVAPSYGTDPARGYPTFDAMMKAETAKPKDEQPDALIVATPNKFHFAQATAALRAGWDVALEKPVTYTVNEARELVRFAAETGRVLMVAHMYTEYDLPWKLREMVLNGDLGEVWFVRGAYEQEWLHNPRIEFDPAIGGHGQAKWRLDPNLNGCSCCFGDIGSHWFDLSRFVTGLDGKEISARLSKIPDTRLLDTHGTAEIVYSNGARGQMCASQVMRGKENSLWIEVCGTKRTARWHQETPTQLFVSNEGCSWTIYTPGGHTACWPGGHSEGLSDAWSAGYRAFLDAVAALRTGSAYDRTKTRFRTEVDGLHGMLFVDGAVKSSAQNGAWVSIAP